MRSRAIIKALSTKNKFGFINGTIINLLLLMKIMFFENNDNMVASWIMNAIIPELAGDSNLYRNSKRLMEGS